MTIWIILGAVVLLGVVLASGGAKPHSPPSGSGHTGAAEAAIPAAGFWCIPKDELFFLKLKILPGYTTPFGRVSVYSSVEAPTWAVIANVEMLCQHYPWLQEKLTQITSHCGMDVFHRSAADAEYPLQIVFKALLEQKWSYVLDGSNGQALFCAASPPPYGLAVKKELLGELVHRPANVRLVGVSEVICITPEGERGEAVAVAAWRI